MTKLITRSELSRCSLNELRGFYRHTFNQLVQSYSETSKRRNALASLENINNELNIRYSMKNP